MKRHSLWSIVVLLALGAAGTALLLWELADSPPLLPDPEAPLASQPPQPPRALVGTDGPARLEEPARQAVPEEEPELPPVPEDQLLGRVVDTQAQGKAGVKLLLLEAAPPARGQRGDPAEMQARRIEEFRKQLAMRVDMEAKFKASGLGADQIQAYLDRMRSSMGLKQLASAVSEAGGFYRFPRPAVPGGGMALLVQAEAPRGYLQPEMLEASRHLESGRLPDIVLIRPAALHGSVTGLLGERFRAEVVAWRLGEDASLERRSQWIPPGGIFALENLLPGTWRLGLHQRWAESAFQWGPVIELAEGEKREGLSLALAPECALELNLLGPGRSPLEAATHVSLALRRLGPKGEIGDKIAVEQELSSQSPSVGEPCRFEKLSPGFYRVEAVLAGLARVPARGGERPDDFRVAQEVELVRGLHRIELVFPRLPQLGSLDVLVTGNEGAPLPGARVSLIGQPGPVRGPGSGIIPGASQSVMTDARGIASFRGLVPARYRINVWAQNYLGGNETFDLAGEGEGAHVLKELALLQAAACRGRVVDAGGQGIAGVMVRLVPEFFGRAAGRLGGGNLSYGHPASSAAVTDAQGRFQLNNLPAGRFELQATQRGGGSTSETVRLAPGHVAEVTLRL